MNKLKNYFGSGPIGSVLAFILAIILIKIEKRADIKKIVLNNYLIILIWVLLALGLFVMIYSFISLPLSKRGEHLVKHGLYKYVRHPIYSSVIFLIYPAIALIFRSWLMLVSVILVYLIFKITIRYEEKHLIEIFGEEYKEYMKEVPQFIPRLS